MPEDVIDLTGNDSPAGEGAAPHRKRGRAKDDEDDRNKIMSAVKKINEEKGLFVDISGSPSEAPTKPAANSKRLKTSTATANKDAEPSSTESAKSAATQNAAMPSATTQNSLLAQLHAARMARMAEKHAEDPQEVPEPAKQAAPGPKWTFGRDKASEGPSGPRAGAQKGPSRELTPVEDITGGFSLLTYNIWFNEQHREARMKAIGEIIRDAGFPTFVCLQEVTPEQYGMLQKQPFWNRYKAHAMPWGEAYFTVLLYRLGSGFACRFDAQEVKYSNTQMGRGLRTITGSMHGKRILVSTTHLESHGSWAMPFDKERVEQAEQAMTTFQGSGFDNILFAGDMNWGKNQGKMPLADGWNDAWEKLHPKNPGYTYDGKENAMLSNRYRTRLDRVCYKSRDFKPVSAELVGQRVLPNLTYTKTYTVQGSEKIRQLPVCPSDHFGILVKFTPV